jgi:hypothetical protein
LQPSTKRELARPTTMAEAASTMSRWDNGAC